MKLIPLILLVTSGAFNTFSYAETGLRTGTVEYIRVHDSKSYPEWATPIFWFTLKGVTSSGSCKTWHGRTLFVMDSEQAYSMVLAAHMGGKEVNVYYDDTQKAPVSDYCRGTYLTIGSPAIN